MKTFPLPWWRLPIYLLLFAVCAGVAGREAYYAVLGTTTTGTIVTVSRPTPPRASRYLAQYEYLDESQVRHVAEARVVPATNPGDTVEVQYLRHAPDTSRLAPSPAAGICFGLVAALALAVFVGEIMIHRPRP